MDLRTLIAIGTGLFLTLTAWMLLPGRRALTWFTPRRNRKALGQAIIRAMWTRVTMEGTRKDAEIMGTTPLTLFATILVAVAGGGIILTMLGMPVLILLLIAVAAVIFVPNVMIRRKFTKWQRRVVAGLPSFLHHLQILLDLGLPLVTAVKRARQRADGPLGKELDKIIFQLERGQSVGEAFRSMAEDTRRMETLVLAATLSTVAGRRLSGTALAPLLVMLTAVQEREQEATSQSVDQVASVVPIIATFGALITGLYFMLSMALGGLAGVSL